MYFPKRTIHFTKSYSHQILSLPPLKKPDTCSNVEYARKSLPNPKDTLCVITVRHLAMPGAITSTAQGISSRDSHNPQEHTVNPVWVPNVPTVTMSIWQITVNAQGCWHPSGRKPKPSKIA